MNIIDKMIETVSPTAALHRQQSRMKLEMIRSFQNSGYDESGASRSKNSMRGWAARSLSPQEDIDKNLPTLRQRARSLYMSAPLAVSAIKTNRTNIVGQGLRLKSTIDSDFLGMTAEAAAEWQRNAEREFELWAESKFCDSTRANNFYEIQQTACMSWLMNGDACVLLEYDKSYKFYPYGLRVHLIESDRVSTPHSSGNNVNLYATDPNTRNRIFNGVEVDNGGRVVAYHICSTYPNSNLRAEKKWSRVKAFGEKTGTPNVLMIYETERAEQYRGVPYLAPVIEALKQLTRYSDAEMMAAVINGFFTAFVTSESGTTETGFTGVVDDEDRMTDDDVSYELGPGMVNMLRPGEHIEIADAKRPSGNFDAFTTSLAKYIGAAIEIPVELLTKNFSSSYSASRAALLEAWKAFRMKRSWLSTDFCQPVYEIFLTEAVASGRIKAPGFFLDPMIKKAYCGAQWNGPAQGMLDPVKEVSAAEKRINIGISTRQKETIEMTGGDFENNVSQLARESDLMKKAGLSTSATSSGGEKTEKEIEDDEEENEDENQNRKRSGASGSDTGDD
ncbi:phage portal protein [Lacrimispora indolis]|uniref:phage portal protein n=1 Tax=Lacrimispora indolis TaxID=69825 RepID=UPI0003F95027|nr:phage portal protein [[Clostridium] methoxybenzovorans]